jgi:crotonobetainyl-CoA:carnitine CoA-transferase CaiB-like acyl-CoA transferase
MSSATERPLQGLRVLDLSRVLAGPYVGRMLTDLGADVVKVEPPEGDVTRKWGKRRAGLSGYYTQQNIGKRNICVDLRVAGGPQLVQRLATRADALVENFRPGVMDQYGLSWASLSELNPRLCMLSISGFGQTGPEARRPAYASVVQAESGVVHRQAALTGTKPADPRISIADMNAALHGLVGLLSALLMRERSGRGQHIDISMLESMLATDDYTHLALDGVEEGAGVVSNEIWDAVGGPIVLAGDFRWVWRCLEETYQLKDTTPEDASIPVKSEHRHRVVTEFLGGFSDRAELLRALDKAGLAYGEVKNTATALRSPTLAARGAVVRVDDRQGGTRAVIQSPYRFSNAVSGTRGLASYRGEHNGEVLRDWLELSEQEVTALHGAGVLLTEPPPAPKS